MKGKWSSPCGNETLLKTDELAIRWYTTCNNITINGFKAEEVRKQLKSYVINVTSSAESLNHDFHLKKIDINSAINERSCQTSFSSNNNERLDSLEDAVEILKTQLV